MGACDAGTVGGTALAVPVPVVVHHYHCRAGAATAGMSGGQHPHGGGAGGGGNGGKRRARGSAGQAARWGTGWPRRPERGLTCLQPAIPNRALASPSAVAMATTAGRSRSFDCHLP